MRPLVEISHEIDQIENSVASHMEKHHDATKGCMKYTTGSTEHIELRDWETRLTELDGEHKAAKSALGLLDRVNQRGEHVEQEARATKNDRRTLSERFFEQVAIKGATKSQVSTGFEAHVDNMSVDEARHYAMKTAYPLLSVSANAGVQQYPAMTDLVVPYANQTPFLQNLIRNTPYDQPAVLWREEVLQDHQAALRAEGAAAAQSTYKWTNVTVPMVSISHYVECSKEALEDYTLLGNMIDNELINGLQLKIQSALLSGVGGSSDIDGFLNKNTVQTQSANGLAAGGFAYFAAIRKAFTKLRGTTPGTGFAEPSAILLNPTDWETMSLVQDNIGNYIYGSPAQEAQPRAFGKPILSIIDLSAGNGLVGAFDMWVQLWTRHGIRLETGTINDGFTKRLQVVLADVRMCQTITRGSAFCNLTNLPTG